MPKKKTPRKPKAAPARRTGDTERKRAEEALAAHARQQAALAELGLRALTRIDLATLMDDTVALLSQVLDVDYCKVLELLPDGNALLLRAGVGWKEGYVGHATVDAAANSQAGYTLLHDEPVVAEDLRTETRFSAPPLLVEHGVVSGMSVIIKGVERPFGVLGTHTTSRRTFSSDDINFLQAVANVLAAAIERKRAEEALRLQSDILQNIAEAVYLIRASDGVIVYTNPSFEQMFGYGPGEMIGKHVSVVNAPTDKSPEETAKEIIAALDRTGIWRGEILNIKRDGTPFWCQANVSEFDHPRHGRVWATYHTDITERKRADEALRESEERFRTLYTKTPAMLHSIDTDGNVVTVSNRWLEVLGYERNEVIGRKSFEFLTAESRQYAETVSLPEFWKTGMVRDVAYQFVKKNGEIVDILLSAVVERDPEGNILRTLAVLDDITQRKRAEEALRARTHDLGERVKELGCLYGISHLVEQQDISLDEILQGVAELIPPAWQYPEVTCGRVILEGQEYRTGNFRKTPWRQASDIVVDGKGLGVVEVYYLEERPQIGEGPFLKEERELISAIAERVGDITQRKRLEEKLQQAREALEGKVERKMLRKNLYGLTFREFTVLHHVATGKADKEIAHELGISPLTVHKHVANILGKMSAASRTEAASRALREGLLD